MNINCQWFLSQDITLVTFGNKNSSDTEQKSKTKSLTRSIKRNLPIESEGRICILHHLYHIACEQKLRAIKGLNTFGVLVNSIGQLINFSFSEANKAKVVSEHYENHTPIKTGKIKHRENIIGPRREKTCLPVVCE